MSLTADSIDDGVGRYGSRTRVNRIVYEFTQSDLAGNTTATADLNINGKVHKIIVDATDSKVGLGTTTGKFHLKMADILDSLGTTIPFFDQLTGLDFGATSPAPYHFQTTEGGAQNDSADPAAVTICNHLVVSTGVSSGAAAPSHAAGVITTPAAWTGVVCGKVQINLQTTSAWAVDTGSIIVIIIYD
jgi:hypothetical protein